MLDWLVSPHPLILSVGFRRSRRCDDGQVRRQHPEGFRHLHLDHPVLHLVLPLARRPRAWQPLHFRDSPRHYGNLHVRQLFLFQEGWLQVITFHQIWANFEDKHFNRFFGKIFLTKIGWNICFMWQTKIRCYPLIKMTKTWNCKKTDSNLTNAQIIK